jgi:type I restriction enzyme ecoAI specificity protein
MNTKQIRQTILDLAIRGELVPQDPTDEPASVLLERIRAEKEQLIKDKKLKRDKKDNEPIDEVPFELPEGWEWCRGYEILNPMETQKPIGEMFGYIDIASIDNKNNRIIDAKFISVSEAPSRASRKVKFGDTLFSMVRPYLKNIAFVEEEYSNCIASTGFYICNPNKTLYPKFLFYLMLSEYVVNGLNKYMKGDNSPSINNENITNFFFPLPPLAEQERIVEKVEQLLTIVDTIEQLQEGLKALVKQTKNQVLNYAIAGKLTHQDPNDEPAEALLKRIGKTTTTATDTPYEKLPKGWAWCRLGEVANISMGQSPKGETVTRNSNGIEFHQGKIYFTDKYINKSPFFTSEPTKTTSNSVLLCVRAPVGDVNLVNREVCIGRGLCAIEPLGNISIDFCFFWLILLKDYFNENSTGSTFSSISGEIIRNAFIPLPPLAEQHRIVQQIETFFASFDQIERMLA